MNWTKFKKLVDMWNKAKRRIAAFVDIGSIINVGVGIIVVGIIFLILAFVTPVIDQNLPANSTWTSAWTSIAGYAKTAFMFIGLGFIIGGAVYILRLVIRSFGDMF